jgi:hypothetical protein
MGPVRADQMGGKKEKGNGVGKLTFAQGTPNHEPGALDNKFAFPSHCVVFCGVTWFNKGYI